MTYTRVLIARKIKQSLGLSIRQFFIFFLTYHALKQVKNVDQSLSFVQRFSELMKKTFSTQGIFNFSSSSKFLFAGKIALFALAAIIFGSFVYDAIKNSNSDFTQIRESYENRKPFKNEKLNLLSTKMIKTFFSAFVPFLIPVLASLYNQNSNVLMICSLIVAAWYMFSAIINDKNIYGSNYIIEALNYNPISYLLNSIHDKKTKLFNLLKTLPSTIIDGVYETVERIFIKIIDCFLSLFEKINLDSKIDCCINTLVNSCFSLVGIGNNKVDQTKIPGA